MQFQADILRVTVERPRVNETTALGAAFLAGLGAGYYGSIQEVETICQLDRSFVPEMSPFRAQDLYQGWKKAVERSKAWL